MRMKPIAVLLLALLFAVPSFVLAQEQTGSIEGIVKDAQDKAIPGATVEAKSAGGVTLTATSDTAGAYRFPALQSGVYEVTAKLTSFKPGRVPNVVVNVGAIKTVNFMLEIGQMSENLTVTAATPLVDVKTSGRSLTVRSDDGLPSGRDFLSIVTRMPGTNNEAKSGGIMVDGATASENRYVIDGVETTDLVHGTSGKALIADFLEEVQIKSSGYTAEYGGSTGGVINAITKSGTNRVAGNVLFNWQGSSVSGNSKTLRTKLADSTQAEYITYPLDDSNRFEPGFSLGGPLKRDKVWGWLAYQPAITNASRTVDPSTSQNPKALAISHDQKTQVQYLSANSTAQISSKLHARVAFNDSWSRVKGLLPSLNGTDPSAGLDVNYLKTSTSPNWTLSANADYVASPSLVFGVRGGYYFSDLKDSDVPNVSRYTWTTTSNVNFVGTNGVPVPPELQHGTNFTSLISDFASERDQQKRTNFQADVTWYGRAGGTHQIKGGVQFDRRANDVFQSELGHRVTFRWGSSLSGQRGPFGYYSVRSAVDVRADPGRYGGTAQADLLRKRGFTTIGDIRSNLTGLFIQDAWSMNDRLTINLGLRTEQEEVPIYGVVPGISATPIKFGFGDKVAPRLGFAYDLRGDGKDKVYGSWGVFYDIFKLNLPRGSYGGDKWTEYYYTLDTPDWTTVNTAPGCPPACSGTLLRITDFRLPTYSLNPEDCAGAAGCTDANLKPMRSEEFSVGYEHQIQNNMAAAVRYVHKQLDRVIEDLGGLDSNNNEVYVIGNPGEGSSPVAYTDATLTVPLPKGKRDYDGVEFTFDRRMSNNWFFRGSYLWSRLYGNYPGLSETDENGRVDPNSGRLYDYPLMMFKADGTPNYGLLPTDRPHQVKLQFLYQLPFGTSFGLSQVAQSGIPVTAEMGVFPASNFAVQWKGRGSDGRTDVLTQTDFFVQHTFKLGARSLQVNMNVLNLFNQQNAVNKFITYQAVNGISPDESKVYRGDASAFNNLIPAVVKDPRFLMDNAFQPPIQARFGAKFLF